MADLFKMLQQAQQMQARLQQMQEELGQKSVTGTAGGGMVVVEADGRGHIRSVKLDPTLLGSSDREMVEDLIVVAVNDAQKKAGELAKQEMGKISGGMDLPFKLPF